MKKAYLVVDMSNDFVHENGSLTAGAPARAIESAVLKRLDEFNAEKNIIVFCMDNHKPDDEHFKLWPVHNVIGTWGCELYGGLKEWYEENKQNSNVYFLPKSEYDAFYKTDLEELLKKEKVETVYVSGVCTDICVFNTVYGAYKCGFKTVVAKNECATFTANQDIFLNQMAAIYRTEVL